MKSTLIDWKYFDTYKLKPLVVLVSLSGLIYLGTQIPVFLVFIILIIVSIVEWIAVRRISSQLFCNEEKFIIKNYLNLFRRRIEIPFSDIKVLRINKKIPSSTIYNIEFVLKSGKDRFIWFQKITEEDIKRIRDATPKEISIEVLS